LIAVAGVPERTGAKINRLELLRASRHKDNDNTMRIESIENIPIEIPLKKNFGGSTYNVLKRCTIITRVRTDEGLVSEVYNGDNRDHGAEIIGIIQRELAPLMIGENPLQIEQLWEKMYEITFPIRDRKVAMEAIACVDTALWDLLGKACGVNVCTLLGGYRTSLPIISIAGYYEEGKTLDDLAREMDWLKSVGMAGCKMKVGGRAPEEDAKRVRAARDGAGKDFILAVDANRGWNVPDAIRFARLIEDLDIVWFEEPCHWHDDAYMMARVRQATRIPVNAGQSETTSHGVRRLLAADAVDYVNFDASDAGGITEWRRAAAMCAVHGVRMAHHEEPQIATHMLAAVPHGTYVECFANPERDPAWQMLIANRAQPKNGIIEVPQGAGFGIVLDQDVIARFRID
jgi:L-alanine-DL-glutamate epimerase-like enolase superfamily enzyme